jgi:hypothetical protein
MLTRHRSAEEWIAELDRIMHEYRSTEYKSALPVTRKQTIQRLVDLGFSAGEAVHYLDRHSARPAVSHSPDGQPLVPRRR